MADESRELRDTHPMAMKISDRSSWPVVVTPYNGSVSQRLAASRRKKLQQHVAKVAAAVRTHLDAVAAGVEAAKPAPERSAPFADEVGAVLVQACIGCRGHCCRQGGDHAFISFDTIMHFMQNNPHHSVQEVVDAYVERLPRRSIRSGCVFQHVHGCTLPRDMRADLCNRYYCGALSEFRHAVDAGASPRAFFVPSNNETFDRGIFASPGLVQIVRAPRAAKK